MCIQSLRFRAYVRAYRRLQPHRLVDPSSLAVGQVVVEPLFHNLRVTEDGRPLSPTGDLLAAAQAGVTAVGDLHSLAQTLQPDLTQRLSAALPDRWRELMQTEQPATDWFQDPAFPDLVIQRDHHLLHPPMMEGGQLTTYSSYSLRHDGQLSPLDWCPPLQLASLQPRVVIAWDTARAWRPKVSPSQATEAFYLVGPPGVSTVDPLLWGIGHRPSHQLVVREASTRLTTLAAVQRGMLPSPPASMRPAIWEDGTGGLSTLEAVWTSRLHSMADLLLPAQPRRSRTASQAFGPDLGSGAPWMSLHPTQRDHWRVRQQTLSQQDTPVASQSTQGRLTQDDAMDVAATTVPHGQPWKDVWLRLHDLGLDRSHRMTAWRVLHAVLPCGAMLSFSALREPARDRIQPLLDQAMCPHCLPARTPETLSHMLVTCPVAQQVWTWVAGLWRAYLGTEDPSPPLVAAVLLADDQSAWHPPLIGQPTWLQLRIATLSALSSGAQSRRSGMPTTAASVAAVVVHSLRTAIVRDWQRVISPDTAELARGVCCSSWLKGRHPAITPQQFSHTWARNAALCSVTAVRGKPSLCPHLSLTRPVPLGGGGVGETASLSV